MSERTCSDGDCDRPAFCRDMCRMHYQRWRKQSGPVCTVGGCTTIRFARDMCATHYTRWRKHGDPSVVLPNGMIGRKEARGCSVEGCDEKHGAMGMCQKHYGAARYAADPERFKAIEAERRKDPEFYTRAVERWRAKRDADPEFIRKRAAGYYQKHRDVRRADARRYRKANPDKHREWSDQYRARRRGAEINDLTAAQWREIKAIYKFRCAYCHKKTPLTQDHVIPLSSKVGGNHTASNVVPACRSCNSRKRTGPPPPFQPALM